MAEIKIDDLREEKAEEVKEYTSIEKLAEKQKLAVRAMAASNGSNVPEWAKDDNEIPSDYQVLSGKYGEILAKYKSAEQDIDVLRAELKEKIRELIDVKKKAEAEATDLKKTISKMQQTHEAEINDLKDQLQEAKAAQAAAEKSKAEINRERIELIDASENDDERFDEILKLARALCRGAGQLEELAMIVEDKVEGR